MLVIKVCIGLEEYYCIYKRNCAKSFVAFERAVSSLLQFLKSSLKMKKKKEKVWGVELKSSDLIRPL